MKAAIVNENCDPNAQDHRLGNQTSIVAHTGSGSGTVTLPAGRSGRSGSGSVTPPAGRSGSGSVTPPAGRSGSGSVTLPAGRSGSGSVVPPAGCSGNVTESVIHGSNTLGKYSL